MYIAASARRYLQNVSAGHELELRELQPLLGEGVRTLYVLKLFHEQILDQDFLFRLNLEQFEEQANKFRWPLITVYTPNRLEPDGIVDE